MKPTATILCPGESLNSTIKHADGTLIAVNLARSIRWHHWWVAGDAAAMGWIADTRTVTGVCTVRPCKMIDFHKLILFSRLPFDIQPTSYSMIAALSLAFFLGHRKILVLGDDKCGTHYHDGSPCEEPKKRWDNELKELNIIMEKMRQADNSTLIWWLH